MEQEKERSNKRERLICGNFYGGLVQFLRHSLQKYLAEIHRKMLKWNRKYLFV